MPHDIVVSTFGDLPLYKSHKFEEAVKNVLLKNTETIKNDFKASLQDAENHMWTRFPWDQEVVPRVHVTTNMSNKIKLTSDSIEFDF